MKHTLLVMLTIVVIAVASGTAAAQDLPRFEETDCTFDVPAGVIVDCGDLVVAQDRNNLTDGEIRVAVAILRHPSGNPQPDPIIHLAGGPGNSWLRVFDRAYTLFQINDANRDVIVFDQRGAGLSQPNFQCDVTPPSAEALIERIGAGDQSAAIDLRELVTEYNIACGEALSEQHDLGDFNSVAIAADVDDLRIALGYDEVNLWGYSYGAKLAQLVMRNHPEGIRSVVLDSPVAPGLIPSAVDRAELGYALDRLFRACAEDAACAENYPNLRETFYETVDSLNEEPMQGPGLPLNGGLFMTLVAQALNSPQAIPNIPRWIYSMNERDTETLRELAQPGAITPAFNSLLNTSVICREDFYLLEPAVLESARSTYPDLQALNLAPNLNEETFAICAAYESGTPAPYLNLPVRSAIPTLIVSGEFDPTTPPSNAALVAESLRNSYRAHIPNGGHGNVIYADCPKQIAVEFFNTPTTEPDMSCLEGMTLTFD